MNKIMKIEKEIGLVLSIEDGRPCSPNFYLRLNPEEWYLYNDETEDFQRIDDKYEPMFQSYLDTLDDEKYKRIKGLINE